MTTRALIRATGGFVLALSLAACGGLSKTLPETPIRAGATANEPAVEEPAGRQTIFDQFADRIVQAKTPQERAQRVCLFGAIIAEVWTYRLLYYETGPDEPLTAVGGISKMLSSVKKIEEVGEGPWFETEMFYVAVTMIRAVEGPLRDRARGAVVSAISLNWKAIARGVRTAGGQAYLTSAMLIDVDRMVAMAADGTWTSRQLFDSCRGRLEGRLAALQTFLGIDPGQGRLAAPGG